MDKFILEKAFFCLKNGYILHVDGENGGGEIWENNGYFHWRYFGQSANKATKKELQWIFETIFKSCKFLVFSNWQDISLSYQCNCPRSLWIFSDGKYTGCNGEV